MSYPAQPADQPSDVPGGPGRSTPQHTGPVIAGGPTAAGLRWAWCAFTRNIGAFLVPALVYAAVLLVGLIAFVVISVVVTTAIGRNDPMQSFVPEPPVFNVSSMLVTAAVGIVGALWSSGILRAGTAVLAGRRPTITDGFIGNGTTIAVAFTVTLLNTVLSQLAQGVSFLFYFPSIVLSVLLYFAIVEAARGAGFGEAISSSTRLVMKNLGTVIVTLLLSFAICLTLILPFLMVVVVPIVQLLVFGVHQRVTGNALVEPPAA